MVLCLMCESVPTLPFALGRLVNSTGLFLEWAIECFFGLTSMETCNEVCM